MSARDGFGRFIRWSAVIVARVASAASRTRAPLRGARRLPGRLKGRRAGWVLIEAAAALVVILVMLAVFMTASRDWSAGAAASNVNEGAKALLDSVLAPAAWSDCVQSPAGGTGACAAAITAAAGTGGRVAGNVYVPDADPAAVCPAVPDGDLSGVAGRMRAVGLSAMYCVYARDYHEFADRGDRRAVNQGPRSGEPGRQDAGECHGLGGLKAFSVRHAEVLAFRAEHPQHPYRVSGSQRREVLPAGRSWTAVPASALDLTDLAVPVEIGHVSAPVPVGSDTLPALFAYHEIGSMKDREGQPPSAVEHPPGSGTHPLRLPPDPARWQAAEAMWPPEAVPTVNPDDVCVPLVAGHGDAVTWTKADGTPKKPFWLSRLGWNVPPPG